MKRAEYMREQARGWFVWLKKQAGADGFRFDAVEHCPAYVVGDLLYHAMGPGVEYFAVGEFVGGSQQLDTWARQTQNRSGTFDSLPLGAPRPTLWKRGDSLV